MSASSRSFKKLSTAWCCARRFLMFLEFTGRRSFATPTCVFCDILSSSFSTHILAYFILNYKLFQGLIQNSYYINSNSYTLSI
ncbi:hypothetical protein B6U61_07100 [Ligilactobacillus salivarius]|nr:hypothetical protein B6U61_07100 [Ligilactobacillus salivarius]